MIFFKTREEDPKDDLEIIKPSSLVSKGGDLSLQF